ALRNITKRYPAAIANDSVSLQVMPGEIHALLGENGAGKSTLIRIVYGLTRPDAGKIAVDGAIVDIDSPRRARSLGIAMVLQQFALFDSLSVLQNIALGLPPAPITAIESRVVKLAAQYGLEVDLAERVHDLSASERQRIEILRALMSAPRVLILDEPTSVLTLRAIERLFETLKELANGGMSIVFISHKLHEVRRLATRCVVMRAGKVVAEVDPRTQSDASLAQLMLGVEPSIIATHESAAAEIALEAQQLGISGLEQRECLTDVSFDVRSGEIVGIAGIAGNGQQTLMAALAGELLVESRAIRLFNQPVGRMNAAQRRARGLRYVPEQRLGHAAVSGMTLADNALLTDAALQSSAALNIARAHIAAAEIVQRFHVRAATIDQNIETLSGGNLQKFIVGREVSPEPRVLLLDQPTSGVDAGSAAAIRNELIALREAGCAILIVSEDIDELYELADRLIVMANGRMSRPHVPRQLSSAELGRLMAGKWNAEEHGSEQAENVV
ncbi:MAG: ABC transporter ATP-binding protein, partial [Burkholderiaceae bacterium]